MILSGPRVRQNTASWREEGAVTKCNSLHIELQRGRLSGIRFSNSLPPRGAAFPHTLGITCSSTSGRKISTFSWETSDKVVGATEKYPRPFTTPDLTGLSKKTRREMEDIVWRAIHLPKEETKWPPRTGFLHWAPPSPIARKIEGLPSLSLGGKS